MTIETVEQLKEFLAKWQEHTGVLAAESNYKAFVQALTFALGEVERQQLEIVDYANDTKHLALALENRELQAELDRIKNVDDETLRIKLGDILGFDKDCWRVTRAAQAVKDFIIKGE